MERLPPEEQWTHFYDKGKEYRQLDYILLSKALDERARHPRPTIMRQGLPLRATRYTGPRLPGVGLNRPKASDHAAVVVDIPRDAFV